MQKLKISENKRYFVLENGIPFVWLADTDWTMPQRIRWDDVEQFMKKRKSQGFTVLQIVALDPEADPEMRSPAGVPALNNNDLLDPNESYFSYLDWILDQAEAYGFYVLLLPVWGQLVVGHNWMGETFEKTVTEKNAFAYGKWIGSRYKDRPNILWCLGGDRQPIHLDVDYRNVWRRMAEGIARGVTGKDLKYNVKDPEWERIMMTYHACYEAETGECSTMSYWTEEEAWIRFIMLQSGHGLTVKNYELVEKEYGREHPMPVWDGEPAYERMPTSWPMVTEFHKSWMVRKRAYWSLFTGAFGFTYGHCSVWCSVSEKERNEMNPVTWYEALSSEGAAQMKYLRDFMESMSIMRYRPKQKLLLENRKQDILDFHLSACENPEQDTICVYFPSGGEAIVNMTEYRWDMVWLWWYNPRDGKFYDEKGSITSGPVPYILDDGKMMIQAPSAGEECDWVLILKKEKGEPPVREQVYFILDKPSDAKKVFQWD